MWPFVVFLYSCLDRERWFADVWLGLHDLNDCLLLPSHNCMDGASWGVDCGGVEGLLNSNVGGILAMTVVIL